MADRSDALILFGITGDLARKMLFPALHDLAIQGRLDMPVVGVASSDISVEQLRDRARASIQEHGHRDLDEDAFARLAGRLAYVSGDYRQDDTFDRVRAAVGDAKRPLSYLAIPPSLFETVISQLARVGAAEAGRIVVEKPFGRDLASSQQLDAHLLDRFDESAVFRIDHFLGKETVLDLLVMRLANSILDPAWDRHHVESVQITMAEDFGVEGRGRFYEEVGALRDVVQNHLFQVLSLVAMEPPVDTSADSLREEKAKVLKAMRPLDPDDVVRGQFQGYRDEPGVADDSEVETFVALRTYVDTWRWAGVPFHIRAGKSMATTLTEVVIEFKAPPKAFFTHGELEPPHPNHLRFQLKPGERIAIRMQLKQPGDALLSGPVDLVYDYDENRDGRQEEAYTRLLADAIGGDQTLFARTDAVQSAWRVLDPVLRDPGPVHLYPPGSWGPEEADRVAPSGGWHQPGDDAPRLGTATGQGG